MKSKIKYVLKLLKVLIYPILFMIGEFLINYIFVSIYNNKEKGNMDNEIFINYIKTNSYKVGLNNYINSKSLLIIIITMLIFLPIFYNIYKKYKQKNNFKINNIFVPIILGISIALIYNILIYNISIFIPIKDFKVSELPILIQIICSGICGPILEELVFRGIVYNKLKQFNSKKTSIILCSLIFALMHMNIIESIYAFIVSFVLIYLYEKYKTLKALIIMHMSLNITVILMLDIIIKNYIIFNLYIFIISVTALITLKIYLKNKYNN